MWVIIYNIVMTVNGSKLILFDIDGTLMSAGGAGTRSMNLAFGDLFGIEDGFSGISMAGKTDPQIIREGLRLHGLPYMDGNLAKMEQLYLRYLSHEINTPERELKPGVRQVLDYLKALQLPLGLLTGNLKKGAEIKLSSLGICDLFLDGAFGSDHEDRNRLLPIAVQKFSLRGHKYLPENCIVIGDTPADVECAHIHGASCIAVATGPYSMDELSRTGAELVIDSLSENGAFIDYIMS